MRATLPSVCPHDCPSQCALQVTVEAGRITDVTGDLLKDAFTYFGIGALLRGRGRTRGLPAHPQSAL